MKDYDKFLETFTTVSKCLNIKNSSTTFLAMIELTRKNLNQLKEVAFENELVSYVPISAVLGRSDISKEDAKIIDKALNKMISKGEILKTEKEKGLTILAKQYLKLT